MIVRCTLISGLLLVLGCSGQDDGDLSDLSSDRLPVGDDGSGDDDDVTVSGDSTAEDDGVFDIYYLQVDATFGWDRETGSLVDVVTDYGDIPPAIAISLGERRWANDDFSSESEAYCLIVLPLTDSFPAPNWVNFDLSLYYGFDYQLEERPLTDCGTEDYAYDENLWGRNLAADWATLGWGVAIGDLRPEYQKSFATSILLPHLVGAQINNQLIRTSGNEGVLGYVAVVSAIDAGHQLVVEPDGRQPMLPAEDVAVPGGGMASGLYQVLPLYIFTFSQGP